MAPKKKLKTKPQSDPPKDLVQELIATLDQLLTLVNMLAAVPKGSPLWTANQNVIDTLLPALKTQFTAVQHLSEIALLADQTPVTPPLRMATRRAYDALEEARASPAPEQSLEQLRESIQNLVVVSGAEEDGGAWKIPSWMPSRYEKLDILMGRDSEDDEIPYERHPIWNLAMEHEPAIDWATIDKERKAQREKEKKAQRDNQERGPR